MKYDRGDGLAEGRGGSLGLLDGLYHVGSESVRAPQEHRYRRDRWACTPHNTPVMYAPVGQKVRAVQRL